MNTWTTRDCVTPTRERKKWTDTNSMKLVSLCHFLHPDREKFMIIIFEMSIRNEAHLCISIFQYRIPCVKFCLQSSKNMRHSICYINTIHFATWLSCVSKLCVYFQIDSILLYFLIMYCIFSHFFRFKITKHIFPQKVMIVLFLSFSILFLFSSKSNNTMSNTEKKAKTV